MRTTFDVDRKLLEKAMELSGEKNATRTINRALEAYLRELRSQRLLAALGHRDLDLEDAYAFRHQERT